MAKKKEMLFYVPVRLTSEDMKVLDSAAQSQKANRSIILWNLIRSLGQTSDSPIPA